MERAGQGDAGPPALPIFSARVQNFLSISSFLGERLNSLVVLLTMFPDASPTSVRGIWSHLGVMLLSISRSALRWCGAACGRVPQNDTWSMPLPGPRGCLNASRGRKRRGCLPAPFIWNSSAMPALARRDACAQRRKKYALGVMEIDEEMQCAAYV